MADNDWRVTVTLEDSTQVRRVLQVLREHEADHDGRRALGGQVAVGAGESQIFLYAGSESAARDAELLARDVLADLGLSADFGLHRWHPDEEDWEGAEVPVPQTAEQRQAEHQRLEDAEARDSLATGRAQYEVRIDLPSHRDAVALAARLRAEGQPVIRRWKFLVVGAKNSDEAEGLAAKITQEAPAGASVQVREVGPVRPFIQFGDRRP